MINFKLILKLLLSHFFQVVRHVSFHVVFVVLLNAFGKLIMVANLYCLQFYQKNLVQQVHLVLDQLIVVLKKLHLNSV